MENLNELPGPALLAMAIMIVMRAVKASPLKRWLIPYLAFGMGAAGQIGLEGWSVNNLLIGIVIGAGAVGLHQGIKQAGKAVNGVPMGLLAAGLLIGATGCATTGPAQDPAAAAQGGARTAALVQSTAQLGVYFAVREDKNARSYLQAAHLALGVLIDGGAYDPVELDTVLEEISMRELRSPEAQVSLAAALELYRSYWGEEVTRRVDRAVRLRPVLVGLRNGIALGLQERKAPPEGVAP
jgi:hypothetical protein